MPSQVNMYAYKRKESGIVRKPATVSFVEMAECIQVAVYAPKQLQLGVREALKHYMYEGQALT